MPITVKVKVLRPMHGSDEKGQNKEFQPGQFRTLPVADAERLAETGAVEIVGKPANKSQRQAPKVPGAKAAPARQTQAAPRLRNQAKKSAPATKAS